MRNYYRTPSWRFLFSDLLMQFEMLKGFFPLIKKNFFHIFLRMSINKLTLRYFAHPKRLMLIYKYPFIYFLL